MKKKQKYIMSEKEYKALDTYLTVCKAYDSYFFICQGNDTDYGFDYENKEVMSLKTLIDMLYYDNFPEDLIGYKSFTKDMMKTIKKLYKKLEHISLELLPSVEQSIKILGLED